MTEKPTERAWEAAVLVNNWFELGLEAKGIDRIAAIIDREAVAPAVRELVQMLARCPQYIYCAHEDGKKAGLNKSTLEVAKRDFKAANELLDRYRHLLEAE